MSAVIGSGFGLCGLTCALTAGMQDFNDRSKAYRTTYLTRLGTMFLLSNLRNRGIATPLRNALPPGLDARAQLAVEVRFYCGP